MGDSLGVATDNSAAAMMGGAFSYNKRGVRRLDEGMDEMMAAHSNNAQVMPEQNSIWRRLWNGLWYLLFG